MMSVVAKNFWKDKDVVAILTSPSIPDFYDVSGLIFNGCTFSDNKWNFSELNELGLSKHFYIYDFNKIHYSYRNYAKVVILFQWFVKELQPSSINRIFNDIVNFCEYLLKNKITNVKYISKDVVHGYLKIKNVKERTLQITKIYLKLFLMEIETRNENVSYRSIYDSILDVNNNETIEAEKEIGKTPLIPMETYKKIVSLAIKDVCDERLSIIDRMSACMIVILAETGMRIGEFILLKVNMLKELKFEEDNEAFYYLKFITYKTTGTKDWKWTKTFMTEKAILAYKTLEDILSNRRKSNFLYISDLGKKYASPPSVRNHMIRFFIRHQTELEFNTMTEEELKYYSVRTIKKNDIRKFGLFLDNSDIGRKIFFTSHHQFRVNVCTILAKKKHLDWVRKHMNHLTQDMTEHYIRREAIRRRKIDGIERETLLLRASKNGKLLDVNSKTKNEVVKKELSIPEMKEAYESINAFLEKGKFNIFKDIKQIIELLRQSKTAITETAEGFCARTAFEKICERQQYISSMNDMYFLGPQIINIKDLDFTYVRFKEKIEVIKHNEKLFKENQRYKTELLREKKAMVIYIEKKVLPEIEALTKTINEKGENEVIEKYPNLKSIVSNLPKIYCEVLKWKTTTD